MLTKADFHAKIQESIGNGGYPALAPYFYAGDPRLLQHLDAMAAMLAMFSSQLEVAMMEPFDKTRNSTVLADAAMRGIVRKATPARVSLSIASTLADPYTLTANRVVLDSNGYPYVLDANVTIPAGGSATVTATQYRTDEIIHTVTDTEPFYAIEIPTADDGSYLSGIALQDNTEPHEWWEFRDRYVNTAVDEKVFHVEIDDRQRTYIRLGYADVVGVQPNDGTSLKLFIQRSMGLIDLEAGSPFALDYVSTPESSLDITLASVLTPGQNPIDFSTLRDLARYPSVYDGNAVYLGEFDFLVRRDFPTLQFLSVWNESVEESIRGADVGNINTLFVACLSLAGDETTKSQPDPNTPVAPDEIAEEDYTETQQAIKAAMLAADDSYRVRFYTPVVSEIGMTLTARVATSYVPSVVEEQIKSLLLAEYGQAAPIAKRGGLRPLYQRIYALLVNGIPALQGGTSDLQVSIAFDEEDIRPELWRYVTEDSLSITVTLDNVIQPSWH